MADTNYNISQLFSDAFGITGVGAYKIEQANEQVPGIAYTADKIVSTVAAAATSSLNTPVVYPWRLNGREYRVYNSKGEIETKSYRDLIMPYATLIDFRRAKIIRKTKPVANKGSVKELYGWGDWSISVRGFFIGDSNSTALEQYEAFLKWDEIADSIYVSGEQFKARKIDKISIEEIEDRQLRGNPNILPFQMQCYSDEPLELLL